MPLGWKMLHYVRRYWSITCIHVYVYIYIYIYAALRCNDFIEYAIMYETILYSMLYHTILYYTRPHYIVLLQDVSIVHCTPRHHNAIVYDIPTQNTMIWHSTL